MTWTETAFSSSLNAFAAAVDPRTYLTDVVGPQPLRGVLEMRGRPNPLGTFSTQPLGDDAVKCAEVVQVAEKMLDIPTSDWVTSIAPWEQLVETIRRIWGENWKACWLASKAAAIKSASETSAGFSDLFNHKVSLCRRARYARLRAGTPNWWKRQLSRANHPFEQKFVLLLALNWCSSTSIAQVTDDLETALQALTEADWINIHIALHQHQAFQRGTRGMINTETMPSTLSPRLATALALRAKLAQRRQFYKAYLSDYSGSDPIVLDFCAEQALEVPSVTTKEWRPNLPVIKHAFKQGVISDRYAYEQLLRNVQRASVPLDLAQVITDDADEYPGALVGIAEARIRQATVEHIVPVGTVAKREGWFA